MKRTKNFVAGVSYEGRIEEYNVVATNKVQGRDLMVQYLAGGEKWKRIVLESEPGASNGEPRVVGKKL